MSATVPGALLSVLLALLLAERAACLDCGKGGLCAALCSDLEVEDLASSAQCAMADVGKPLCCVLAGGSPPPSFSSRKQPQHPQRSSPPTLVAPPSQLSSLRRAQSGEKLHLPPKQGSNSNLQPHVRPPSPPVITTQSSSKVPPPQLSLSPPPLRPNPMKQEQQEPQFHAKKDPSMASPSEIWIVEQCQLPKPVDAKPISKALVAPLVALEAWIQKAGPHLNPTNLLRALWSFISRANMKFGPRSSCFVFPAHVDMCIGAFLNEKTQSHFELISKQTEKFMNSGQLPTLLNMDQFPDMLPALKLIAFSMFEKHWVLDSDKFKALHETESYYRLVVQSLVEDGPVVLGLPRVHSSAHVFRGMPLCDMQLVDRLKASKGSYVKEARYRGGIESGTYLEPIALGFALASPECVLIVEWHGLTNSLDIRKQSCDQAECFIPPVAGIVEDVIGPKIIDKIEFIKSSYVEYEAVTTPVSTLKYPECVASVPEHTINEMTFKQPKTYLKLVVRQANVPENQTPIFLEPVLQLMGDATKSKQSKDGPCDTRIQQSMAIAESLTSKSSTKLELLGMINALKKGNGKYAKVDAIRVADRAVYLFKRAAERTEEMIAQHMWQAQSVVAAVQKLIKNIREFVEFNMVDDPDFIVNTWKRAVDDLQYGSRPGQVDFKEAFLRHWFDPQATAPQTADVVKYQRVILTLIYWVLFPHDQLNFPGLFMNLQHRVMFKKQGWNKLGLDTVLIKRKQGTLDPCAPSTVFARRLTFPDPPQGWIYLAMLGMMENKHVPEFKKKVPTSGAANELGLSPAQQKKKRLRKCCAFTKASIVSPPLTDEEAEFAFAKLDPSIKKAGDIDTKKPLPWLSGWLDYDLGTESVTDPLQPSRRANFVGQAFLELGLPLKSGPSGSTDLFMWIARYFSWSQQERCALRDAMMAWMLPSQDHTFYEILLGAAPDCPIDQSNWLQIYQKNIPQSLHGNIKFPDCILTEPVLHYLMEQFGRDDSLSANAALPPSPCSELLSTDDLAFAIKDADRDATMGALFA